VIQPFFKRKKGVEEGGKCMAVSSRAASELREERSPPHPPGAELFRMAENSHFLELFLPLMFHLLSQHLMYLLIK
jgi:hypothetical protein